MAFAIADRRVVNHGVEVAECIDLGCNFLSAGDRLDVADHDRLGLGRFLADCFSALGVTGVKDDAVLTSKSAAIRPRPVDDPEMKMRDMVLLLS